MAECSSSSSPYGFPSVYKGSLLLPRPASAAAGSAPPFYGYSSSNSSTEARASAALRIHSEAERRRRERINTHLSTLRRMIPDSSKMDKASLLARVVEQMKDLKRQANDVRKRSSIPPEVNEVSVDEYDAQQTSSSPRDHENLYIKASICCEDRPDLFQELIQAFNDLRLRTIRADFTSLGGRVHNIFVLCHNKDNQIECLSSLKESIKESLGRIASTDLVSASSFPSKRRRLLQSHYCSMSF